LIKPSLKLNNRFRSLNFNQRPSVIFVILLSAYDNDLKSSDKTDRKRRYADLMTLTFNILTVHWHVAGQYVNQVWWIQWRSWCAM